MRYRLTYKQSVSIVLNIANTTTERVHSTQGLINYNKPIEYSYA
jgi:hypothetical protein